MHRETLESSERRYVASAWVVGIGTMCTKVYGKGNRLTHFMPPHKSHGIASCLFALLPCAPIDRFDGMHFDFRLVQLVFHIV